MVHFTLNHPCGNLPYACIVPNVSPVLVMFKKVTMKYAILLALLGLIVGEYLIDVHLDCCGSFTTYHNNKCRPVIIVAVY